MHPFHIEFPDDALEDLRDRLARTRWPQDVPGAGWSRGVPVDYLRGLVDYWVEEFDWRAVERRLADLDHQVAEIDGTSIHFVHARSPHPDATPIVITHGWPGSFLEFLDVIGPLTRPEEHGGSARDAFHVVLPSIPGYGFSAAPAEPGWDCRRVARAWAELMRRLGYERYVAQGGDWGKVISLMLGEVDPHHVAGVHVNMFSTFPAPGLDVTALDERDRERVDRMLRFLDTGMGWAKLQSTRPQTLAYSLTDSPVGQLAWIVEKFVEWTGAVKAPEEVVDRDGLLAIVTLYWLTGTAGSSAQLYFETTGCDADAYATWAGPWPLAAPVGVAVFPHDASPPVRSLAEAALPSLVHWTECERGGHFAAMEQPELLVEDVRVFTRLLRRS